MRSEFVTAVLFSSVEVLAERTRLAEIASVEKLIQQLTGSGKSGHQKAMLKQLKQQHRTMTAGEFPFTQVGGQLR